MTSSYRIAQELFNDRLRRQSPEILEPLEYSNNWWDNIRLLLPAVGAHLNCLNATPLFLEVFLQKRDSRFRRLSPLSRRRLAGLPVPWMQRPVAITGQRDSHPTPNRRSGSQTWRMPSKSKLARL
jgi:hypothetical protein